MTFAALAARCLAGVLCLAAGIALAQTAVLAAPAPPASAARPVAAPASAPAAQRIEIQAEALSDTETRRRDPVARTVYGREELDKYGDISVTDVLKRLPGINLSGGNPRLRGLGAGYTLILVNGEPAPPGFSLENLPPSQVERIEVTKGPTAERSAQAVAGTINIILRAAPRQRQRELNLRLGYAALRPTGGFNAMLSDRHGELSVSLPFSGYQWAGGADYATTRETRDTAGLPQALHIEGSDRWWGGGGSFSPRLNWKASESLTLESQSFIQRSEFGTKGAYRTGVLAGSTPTSVDDNTRLAGYWQVLRTGLSLTQKLQGGARLEARAGVQAQANASSNLGLGRNALAVQTIERVTTGDNAEQSRSTSGKFTQPLGDAHTLAAGWDLESRRRRETRAITENGLPQLLDFEGEPFHAQVQRLAFYLQDEWEISPQWGTYLGARIETLKTTSDGSAGALAARSRVLTPVLHLNYKLDPKGRDMVRASLTRAYRVPELSSLMARPSINNNYPVGGPNPENAPDRVGNPALKPELSTGLDIAFERYFAGGGVMSLGLFHKRVEGLIRNAVTKDSVPWSSVERWVSHPVNLSGARSTGLEFEIKGRGLDLLPALVTSDQLQVRGSLSVYRSQVNDLPGPDNRLEQQQPWSLTLGLDDKRLGGKLGYGASLAYTPGYTTQQTAAQTQALNRVRTLDLYASWTLSREVLVRLSVNNWQPLEVSTETLTQESTGGLLSNRNLRKGRAQWNAGLSLKF